MTLQHDQPAVPPEPCPALLAQVAEMDVPAALRALGSSPQGLTSLEAARRLARFGPNEISSEQRALGTLVREQMTNGISLLLALAGLLTFVLGDPVDGTIIVVLLGLNVGLSIFQEYRAEQALRALRALLPVQAQVWRDGSAVRRPVRELVPGDVVALATGDLVPADVRLLVAESLSVDQATLTGEAEPQPKDPAPVTEGPPARWRDILFAGTTVVSGWGRGVVVATGERTQFGQTAALLREIRAPSDFQANLARFGGFLLRFGLFLAGIIFVANALLGRGLVVSLTLALALALGAVPEALPAVTATTLALGAAALAQQQVLVRRLAAIEELSAVDTLCTDKTGTITEHRTAVTRLWTWATPGAVIEAATLCSGYPTPADPVDQAVIAAAEERGLPLHVLEQLPRRTLIPFSPETKRMCVLVEREAGLELICKGAVRSVLPRCTRLRTEHGDVELAAHWPLIEAALAELQRAGARVLVVALRQFPASVPWAQVRDDELVLVGLLGLADPPRPGAAAALARAEALGVQVKIVTGDALQRATALAEEIGLRVPAEAIVEATALRGPSAAAVVERGRIFAEVVPADKYRLVRALQANGHHVAMTGDGVNDAPALKAADVGIALASGSDAAKGASDLVLLQDDLRVIIDGLEEGRRVFTNINRYLLYTMISNVANVLVVAVATLFLDFLPLLPAQVLVLNLLADLPMLAIVTDRVAEEDLAAPRHWDVRRLVELALYLGLTNAVFAFGLLRFLAGQPPPVVHSAWFLLLGTTALLVLFVARTPRWLWQAPPPSPLVLVAVGGAVLALVGLINLVPARSLLNLAPLSAATQAAIGAYALSYVLTADLLKRAFVRAGAIGRRP